jgi:hypothetical protein
LFAESDAHELQMALQELVEGGQNAMQEQALLLLHDLNYKIDKERLARTRA